MKSGEASGDIETDGSELFLGNDALFSWLDLALDGVSMPEGVSSPLMAELIGRLCRLAVSDDCLSILSKSLFERDLRNKNKGSYNFSLPCK